MSNLTYTEANRLLDLSLGTVFLAAYAGSPGRTGSGGTEIALARQACAFDASSNGVTQNTGAVTFDQALAALGTADYWALFSLVTGGTLRWYAPILSPAIALGGSTTRFDITKTGSIVRYTFDGTGTDPGLTGTTPAVGDWMTAAAQNFNAANNGVFQVINSGTNWFEIDNADGLAENDKTLGTGTLKRQYPNSFEIKAGVTLSVPLGQIIVRMV